MKGVNTRQLTDPLRCQRLFTLQVLHLLVFRIYSGRKTKKKHNPR
jgi:hypothetical protein